MKKIVLLSERLPYPPTSGTKNLLYNYCKILHEKLNLEVINISFLEQDENISAKPDFISRVYTMPNPSGKTKLKNKKTGWYIEKDRAGSNSHGGSAYKLFNNKGKREATLDKNGKVLRK